MLRPHIQEKGVKTLHKIVDRSNYSMARDRRIPIGALYKKRTVSSEKYDFRLKYFFFMY